MKSFLKLFIIGLIVVLIAFIWIKKSKHEIKNDSKYNLETVESVNTNFSKTNAHVVPTSSKKIWKQEIEKRKQLEAIAERHKSRYKTPISFYGRVVDEKNNPVAEADIIMDWQDLKGSETSKLKTSSDNLGFFSLEHAVGKSLSVRVSKLGYYSMQYNPLIFEYAEKDNINYHVSDSKKPVVFYLRKKGIAEPLLFRSNFYGFPIDGTPIYWDVETDKRSQEPLPSADLIVSIKREPDDLAILQSKHIRQFNWSVIFETTKGAGLLESNEEFMFEAPNDGYYSRIEFRQSAGDKDWKPNVLKKFYIRVRQGQLFGRFEAEVMPKYNDSTAIHANYYLNPSGSRNLEFDEKKKLPGSD